MGCAWTAWTRWRSTARHGRRRIGPRTDSVPRSSRRSRTESGRIRRATTPRGTAMSRRSPRGKPVTRSLGSGGTSSARGGGTTGTRHGSSRKSGMTLAAPSRRPSGFRHPDPRRSSPTSTRRCPPTFGNRWTRSSRVLGGDVLAKKGSAAPAAAPSSSSGVQRAHELFKQGRAKEALAILLPLLQRKGNLDGDVCALAAACLGAEGDYLEAARIDRMLSDAQPNNPQAWHSLGYDLLHAGDLEGAADAFARALKLEPTRASAHFNLARIAGVFSCTEGLTDEFPDGVFDTPLAEGGIIGTSIGMALYGLRPVPEIQFMDFIYPGFDQIVSEAAKMRYRSGGQFSVPMTIRTPFGGGIRGGHYHSQSTEAYFCHTPGLKVVVPSTPKEAKGLLTSSIRDPDPVLFLEPKKLYRSSREEVPEGEVTVPLGQAAVRRAGKDVTLIAYGYMAQVCLEAATKAADKGVEAEVIDLRTLVPLDEPTILTSVKKTGRAVVVYEAPRTGGYGAEISAILAEKAIEYLRGPIVRVTGFDTPFPYTLEDVYLPNADRVLAAIDKVMAF